MKLYDSVALLEDLPEDGLIRGNVGVIIEYYTPDAVEVEFSNRKDGITYATVVLQPEQLMVLYYDKQ